MDYQSGVGALHGRRNSSKQLYPTINLQDLNLLISYLNESQRYNVQVQPRRLPLSAAAHCSLFYLNLNSAINAGRDASSRSKWLSAHISIRNLVSA